MNKNIVSNKVQQMQPSGIRVFFDLVLGMKDVISLGIGEPDFVTPWHIRESAIYSIEQGYTSYTSNKGLLKLRAYISQDIKKQHGLEYDINDEILVTVGVSEGVDLLMRAIIDPGDKILIPVPSYVSYGPVAELAGGIAKFISLNQKNGFKLTSEDIEKNMDGKVKAILLNYPCNPTGATYTKKELLALNKVIQKHDILVISDEVYDALTYDFAHTPFATLPGAKERTIYLNGFSKNYAMTGWRVGFACGPKAIIAAMTKIHQYTIMCVPIMSQMAASEALIGPRKPLDDMKREYHRRRDFVIGRLNEVGLRCHKPQGAFYAFPSVRKTGLSSVDFASQLLKKKKVAVVPGTAFGPEGEGYIRISYASGFDQLKEAFVRIEEFVKNR
ncbi:MAG: aromatic amino acid aminotransferase [Candidatus Omnitrophica bacterium CG1_02_44_16]|nr:MAG: aromatic amino acid aminotransferase [Candidatus Omnitrophica bacterium CG1_02_44_16]PIY83962.1 MAG: aromatic amino acid aminotransferase [Candidatus Omnitrophica bacterium CG_4_10_14_0_8_um_filter_44_12]PIZ84161.1 MAG: aromatic amino acid aminotransferase [Candidatus Omnitrophica bacterium CG_4_10_14_0_2_um_filter_44_9]